MYEAFGKKKYLRFLIEDSDRIAEELEDTNGDTYSRMAAAVASILEKYIDIAPRWDALAQDTKNGYADTLERFFGTHQGVPESFLGKLIEVTKGAEERDNFLRAVGDQGFDYTEGFSAEIDNINDLPRLRVFYKKEKDGKTLFEFNQDIGLDTLRAIVNEEA